MMMMGQQFKTILFRNTISENFEVKPSLKYIFGFYSTTTAHLITTMTQTQIPTEYLCPITHKLMKEPMLSKYGHHFERVPIVEDYCYASPEKH